MPAPLVLPVGEYAPDLAAGDGASQILNVYPRTPTSYGPVLAPAVQYNALGARCRGGAAYRDSAGAVYIFAGDATKLYKIVAGVATWQDVTRSTGAYTTGSAEAWRFAYFNGDVVATNFSDEVQRYTLIGGSLFEHLPGRPPKGRYIAVIKNAFLVLGNTWDGTNGNMPQRVWWSAAGDHTNWPILGTTDAAQVQSGAVDLLGPGGWIQGFAPDLINADAVVFQQHGVRKMTYVGPPDIFSFLPIESARGCLCPDSIVVSGGIAYYWGQDGIYAFDGAESRPIGANRIDRTVFAEVDDGNISRVVGAADPINKLIWWAYPSGGASGGNPDRLLCYNWQIDRFSLTHITCETILRLLSIGYSLDELWTLLGYTVDTIPAPLSSEIWTGGRLTLGLFNSDHKLAFLTGAPLAATIETQEIQPEPGRRWMVRSSRPIVDGTGTTATVSIGRRERKQNAVSYTDPVSLNQIGECPVRTSGRYLRAKVSIPASSTAWQHFSGVELDAVLQGSR